MTSKFLFRCLSMLNKFHSFTQFEVSAAKPQTLETTGLLSPINPLGLSLIYIRIKQLILSPSMNSSITRAQFNIILPMILYAALQNTLYWEAESQVSFGTQNIKCLHL